MTSARTTLRVELPLRLESLKNRREHWAPRARRTAEQRAVVRMRLAAERAWPLRLPLEVTITRIAPRRLDREDNLPLSCSAVRDGVADALGVPDNVPEVRWLYDQRRGAPKQYGVIVEVREA